MRHTESLGASRCVGALAVTLVEALHASTGVDELLLACVERVALIAQFERDGLTLDATCGECVAA